MEAELLCHGERVQALRAAACLCDGADGRGGRGADQTGRAHYVQRRAQGGDRRPLRAAGYGSSGAGLRWDSDPDRRAAREEAGCGVCGAGCGGEPDPPPHRQRHHAAGGMDGPAAGAGAALSRVLALRRDHLDRNADRRDQAVRRAVQLRDGRGDYASRDWPRGHALTARDPRGSGDRLAY